MLSFTTRLSPGNTPSSHFRCRNFHTAVVVAAVDIQHNSSGNSDRSVAVLSDRTPAVAAAAVAVAAAAAERSRSVGILC